MNANSRSIGEKSKEKLKQENERDIPNSSEKRCNMENRRNKLMSHTKTHSCDPRILDYILYKLAPKTDP